MMLSLLKSGPRKPGNDIDVYFTPLVDDLKTLWEVGVEAYDAHKKEFFTLKAILIWTINDFLHMGTYPVSPLRDIMLVRYVVKKHTHIG